MAHVEGSNYPLYGQATVEKGEAVNVTMQHIASLIAVNVTNNAAEDIKVSKISFVAPKKIVGAYYIDFSGKSIIYKEHTTASFTSETATLEVTGDATIAAGQSAKFYLGIKPFTAAAGETLTITVSTDKGDCVKDLMLPDETTFTAGKIKTLNFGFVAQKPKIYELVSGTSEKLNAGDEVIIVAAPSDFAISTAQNDNNRGQVDVTKDKNAGTITITNKDNNVQIFKLENGTKTGSFAFKTINGDNIGYIYAASSSNNHLRTEYPMTDNSSWNVTFDGNNANIVAQGTNSHNTLKYNSSSKLFSCYTGGQQNVQIYRLSDGKTKLAKPQINDNFTINAEQITASWTGDNNAQGYYWKLCKGNDILKEVEKTTDTSITIKATDIVGLTQFEEGVKYVLYVKSLGDGENYKNSEEASKEISFGGTSGDEGGKGASYQYTFTASQFSANDTTSLGGLSWTIAGDGNYWGYDGTKGQQFGSGKAPYKTLTVILDYGTYCTDKGTSGGVEKIVINTSGASKIDATFTVKVGGTQIGESTKLTTSDTNYTFEVTDKNNLPTGDIIIEYKQTSSKAMYIKSISVNN